MNRLLSYTPLLAPLAPVALLAGAVWGGSQKPSPEMLIALEPSFDTTDSSEIFFKNMRSIHYEKRPGPAEGVDLYYLRGLDDAPITPFIVHRWIADSAYVMFEFGRGPASMQVDGETVELPREMPDDAFRTAMRLCAEFDRGTTLTTKDGLELSANRRHTRLFERLCRDYLELVDLF
ncbi:MAG: hypothetical protein AAFP04_14585 [Myxococcota bacterium]